MQRGNSDSPGGGLDSIGAEKELGDAAALCLETGCCATVSRCQRRLGRCLRDGRWCVDRLPGVPFAA